ncbi:MAG: hypothetical protein LBU02_00740 [Rickettsiales bacterium]|jgi:hypothetical protein|nr:hypothetical protein [Rickettsiales bacterium]
MEESMDKNKTLVVTLMVTFTMYVGMLNCVDIPAHKLHTDNAELRQYIDCISVQLQQSAVNWEKIDYKNLETTVKAIELIEELQIAFKDTYGATEGLLTFVRSTLESFRDERNRLSPTEDPEVYGLFNTLHNKILEKYNEVRAVVEHNSGQVLPDFAEKDSK